MGDEGLKQQIYEDAYEALMGSKWIGPFKRLYKFIDNIEKNRGSWHEDVP